MLPISLLNHFLVPLNFWEPNRTEPNFRDWGNHAKKYHVSAKFFAQLTVGYSSPMRKRGRFGFTGIILAIWGCIQQHVLALWHIAGCMIWQILLMPMPHHFWFGARKGILRRLLLLSIRLLLLVLSHPVFSTLLRLSCSHVEENIWHNYENIAWVRGHHSCVF